MDIHFDEYCQVERKLSWIAPDSNHLMMRSTRQNIRDVREMNGLPREIPASEWVEKDFVTGYPKQLFEDQGELGACTCAAATGSMSRIRYVRGLDETPRKFSWLWLYDQINGGHDNGSNIIQSLHVISSTGVPPAESYTRPLWMPNRNPQNVPFYKEQLEITVTDSLDCAIALQMNLLPEVPIFVNNMFGKANGDGVAWNGVAPRNGQGNHAIYLAGMKFIHGVWYFVLVNSWSATWGPRRDGTILIPFAGVDNCAYANDGYCKAYVSLQGDLLPAPVLSV